MAPWLGGGVGGAWLGGGVGAWLGGGVGAWLGGDVASWLGGSVDAWPAEDPAGLLAPGSDAGAGADPPEEPVEPPVGAEGSGALMVISGPEDSGPEDDGDDSDPEDEEEDSDPEDVDEEDPESVGPVSLGPIGAGNGNGSACAATRPSPRRFA